MFMQSPTTNGDCGGAHVPRGAVVALDNRPLSVPRRSLGLDWTHRKAAEAPVVIGLRPQNRAGTAHIIVAMIESFRGVSIAKLTAPASGTSPPARFGLMATSEA
jgi:hypothetical protein